MASKYKVRYRDSSSLPWPICGVGDGEDECEGCEGYMGDRVADRVCWNAVVEACEAARDRANAEKEE
jgi:hypothetical protein